MARARSALSPLPMQMVQRDLRRAVEAGRHDADAGAGRGVADHVVVLEVAVPHGARQDAIERDGYILRPEYNERRKFSTLLKMAGVSLSVAFRHISRRLPLIGCASRTYAVEQPHEKT